MLKSGVDRIDGLLLILLAAFRADPALKELMLFEGRRLRREGQFILTSGYLSFVRLLDEALHEMQSAGQLRPELHAQALRSAFIGMFEGMLRDQVLGNRGKYPADFSLEDMQHVFRDALKAFLVMRVKT